MKVEHIFVQKDLSMADGITSASAFAPSPDHLKLINKYTLETMSDKDIMAFPVRAMNTMLDRDYDGFTAPCIDKLVGNKGDSGPLGKPFLCSHFPSELANGRIYLAEKETAGQIDYLKLWVYIPNTYQYQDFIENIVYGVYWAVSVGVAMGKTECTVCGCPWPNHYNMSCDNNHVKGQKYDGVLCWRQIDDVGEFYELSSVYLGAQYGAEIVKKMATEKGKSLEVIKLAIREVNDLEGKAGGNQPEASEIKSVVPYKSFPLADSAQSWSFSAADGNAVLGDPPDWKRYASCNTWYDEDGNSEARISYKLPHHKELDGAIKTVWKGVSSAGGILMGARGGVNIPTVDVLGCKAHLSKHYKEFGKTAPWDVTKIVALVDEGATLELASDEITLIITKGKKVWEFDGEKIIRKEVRQVNEEMKKLQTDLDTKVAEADAFETKLSVSQSALAKAVEEKTAIQTELDEVKKTLVAKEKVVGTYIEEKMKEVTKWYKLSKGETEGSEVDTTVLMKLLERCGDDPELLTQLEVDFKEQAEKLFPPGVRRSSVEDTDGVEGKEKADKEATEDTEGVANSIHN